MCNRDLQIFEVHMYDGDKYDLSLYYHMSHPSYSYGVLFNGSERAQQNVTELKFKVVALNLILILLRDFIKVQTQDKLIYTLSRTKEG